MRTDAALIDRWEAATKPPEVADLLKKPGFSQLDLVPDQRRELAEIRAPDVPATERDIDALAGDGGPGRGVWIHYPWRNLLVRTVEESAFVELRSNRNKWLIDIAEQAQLRRARTTQRTRSSCR